ncbi:SDR family NAD(P)-dependent oxidoreductase [candidate division GN15 bacterium]|nr:SDR family NAD(P)-dependent oxidoreductase [candidate division GN15 bacterium]
MSSKKKDSKEPAKVALVTGGNQGIGLAVCKGLAAAGIQVVLSGRSEERVRKAVKSLKKKDLPVVGLTLDVTSEMSVLKAEQFVHREFGRLDILINNAAVLLDTESTRTIERIRIDIVKQTHEVNFYGALRMIQAFLPRMKSQNFGRIVNVSSGLGQLHKSRPHYVAYQTSKTALNSLTCLVAADTADYDIACNSMTPGWVRTNMGGPNADRTPKEGADTIIWLATQESKEPNGKFFRDREEIPW